MKKLMLICATLTMAIASASTHKIVFYENATLNGKEIKAGEYKAEIDGGKLVLKQGKKSFEANVNVENNDSKFGSTSVRYLNGEGKYQIQEIRIGGTTMKLSVQDTAADR